jgi:hypothetical protein
MLTDAGRRALVEGLLPVELHPLVDGAYLPSVFVQLGDIESTGWGLRGTWDVTHTIGEQHLEVYEMCLHLEPGGDGLPVPINVLRVRAGDRMTVTIPVG